MKGLVGPRWCWVPAMVQGFGPMAHRRFFTAPFVTPGRREQWICCGVNDVALAKILDHLVNGRVSPAGPHGPPSAHRRRGPGLSPGGGRAAGSLPPPGCCSSKRSFASRRCKLFVSSAPVRQLAPRARPARAPSQPCTSRTQPAHSPASPRACVRVAAPRATAGFGSPRPMTPRPPRTPSPRRTAATLTARRRNGPPPSPPRRSPPHFRRRHPRRRLASTALAHPAATRYPLSPPCRRHAGRRLRLCLG